jgi:hypothetical protein
MRDLRQSKVIERFLIIKGRYPTLEKRRKLLAAASG